MRILFSILDHFGVAEFFRVYKNAFLFHLFVYNIREHVLECSQEMHFPDHLHLGSIPSLIYLNKSRVGLKLKDVAIGLFQNFIQLNPIQR